MEQVVKMTVNCRARFIAFFTTQANFNVEPVFIHGKIRQYLGFTSVYIETPLELTAITTTFLMRGFTEEIQWERMGVIL